MTSCPGWNALVVGHAGAAGAAGLLQITIDALAAPLDDIYSEGLAAGRTEAEAYRIAQAKLLESAAALASVPRPRTRQPEARRDHAVSAGRGVTGVAGDLRFA